jgi:hypothetical protein
MVDLPEPVAPTSATVEPPGAEKETWRSTGAPSLYCRGAGGTTWWAGWVSDSRGCPCRLTAPGSCSCSRVKPPVKQKHRARPHLLVAAPWQRYVRHAMCRQRGARPCCSSSALREQTRRPPAKAATAHPASAFHKLPAHPSSCGCSAALPGAQQWRGKAGGVRRYRCTAAAAHLEAHVVEVHRVVAGLQGLGVGLVLRGGRGEGGRKQGWEMSPAGGGRASLVPLSLQHCLHFRTAPSPPAASTKASTRPPCARQQPHLQRGVLPQQVKHVLHVQHSLLDHAVVCEGK